MDHDGQDRVRQILGCYPPSFVRHFQFSIEDHTIHVRISHEAGLRWRCSKCGRSLHACDGPFPIRIFLCLACGDRQTYVHVEIPYVSCPDDGIQDAEVPWMQDPTRWQWVDSRYPDETPIYSRLH